MPLKQGTTAAIAALTMLLSGCGHQPMQPGETHVSASQAGPQGTIPPPVQITPVLPKPTPAVRPETYSVVVSNVRVQELLFALARDARLQIDIDPQLSGTVTLNAVDQTLPQLLQRIARQVDMRYELEGQNLVVMRDTPYLKVYRIDYVNLARDAKIVAGMAMNVTGATSPAGGAAGGQNNSTATVNSVSVNKFWETLIDNVKAILRETDKVLPAGAAAPAATTVPPPQAPAPGAVAAAPPPAAPSATFLEAGSVIANPESGLLNIRATARQHETIQEFLDQVLANSRRQVLIEATVAEVRLSDQYQRGIDWQRLRTNAATFGVPAFGTGNSGLEFGQRTNPVDTNRFAPNTLVFGGAVTSLNLNIAFKLLETFGDVRVLSSPKLSVLNNQFAVLKVVDNIVYFTVQSSQATSGTIGNVQTSVSTTANTVPVGLVMTVVPQISDHDSISLNVRPSISRLLRFVPDPNPLLTTVGNFIPEIQTREMESVLRLESGQVAVLGGLMEDASDRTVHAIPGVRNVPGLGEIFSQRIEENRKTELVIFLRATVIRDPSIEGDYRGLRSLLPREDFMSKPNPAKAAPVVGPLEERPR